MGADTVKIFCPKCQCVYHPPPVRSRSSHHGGAGAAGVDGAAFGTTFPHLFLMTFSNLVPDPLPQNSSYIPRVFGFRVHSSTRQRAGSGASAQAHTSSSAARQRDGADNNKRSFVGRRSDAAAKDSAKAKDAKEAETAEAPQDANATKPAQETTTVTNQKGKSASVSTKQSRGSNDDNPTKDDDNSRKSKTGKRKNDGDSSSRKSEANGSTHDASSKRRRKAENVGS